MIDSRWTLRITDFGFLETDLKGGAVSPINLQTAEPSAYAWAAPEILNGDKPTMASDVVSLISRTWKGVVDGRVCCVFVSPPSPSLPHTPIARCT